MDSSNYYKSTLTKTKESDMNEATYKELEERVSLANWSITAITLPCGSIKAHIKAFNGAEIITESANKAEDFCRCNLMARKPYPNGLLRG